MFNRLFFRRSNVILSGCLFFLLAGLSSAQVDFELTPQTACIRNATIQVEVDLKDGAIAIQPGLAHAVVCYHATAGCNLFSSTDSVGTRTATVQDWQDKVGSGRLMQIRTERPDGLRMLQDFVVYEGQGIVATRYGLENYSTAQQRLHRYVPLSGKIKLTKAIDEDTYRVLDGLSGAGHTLVRTDAVYQSWNNLLATMTTNEKRVSVVAGGLTYCDFAKQVRAVITPQRDELNLSLWAEDSHGRLIEAGERYLADDWFYLDMMTGCPFENLEQYAQSMQQAMDINPIPYEFPTLCGWYASMPQYGGTEWVNHSPGLVNEAEVVAASGFLKYCPIAMRLVPDTYYVEPIQNWFNRMPEWILDVMGSSDANTEQGWWDDEHWSLHGHLREPFTSLSDWCQAVRQRGSIPFMYLQTGLVSQDFARANPGYMLFNDISRLDEPFGGHNPWVTYDYTDPGFQSHLKKVWGDMGRAGIEGVMFDYPHLAWREEGGFEDPYATTASAYRTVFKLAREYMGPEVRIHERIVNRELPLVDMALGYVDSQRVWGDTDLADPLMYTRCGLRWYKTRRLVAYDTDAKNLLKTNPDNRDGLRQVLTMLYVTSGRFLLANSLSQLDQETLSDLARVFPMHSTQLSARPLDAFQHAPHPRVYDFAINPDWHQLVLYNDDNQASATITVPLSAQPADGGPGLSPTRSYYLYDFWNDEFVGLMAGSDLLVQQLRPGEARMLAVHAKQSHPQIVATKQHLMQGYTDLKEVVWKPANNQLSGQSVAVPGEVYCMVVALNNHEITSVHSSNGHVWIKSDFSQSPQPNLCTIEMLADDTRVINWEINVRRIRDY